jgi:hypothetical protein
MTLTSPTMKKLLFLPALFLISVVASAQAPDFTGTWKLNAGKSKLNDQFSLGPKEIIIDQKGNDLNIEKHSSMMDQEFTTKDKLTLDGKECINAGFQDSKKKTTCAWSEDKKSLKSVSVQSIGDGGDMTHTEIFKIDGGSLIIESTASSSYGELVETLVYDKQ